MDTVEMRRELIRDEGLRTKPYKCTAGRLTIGIGRNLDDKGISREEAMILLDHDIRECYTDLEFIFPDQFHKWPEELQRALINMRFQLGYGGFRSFEKMLEALRAEDREVAAVEAIDSKWAQRDTPERAARVAEMIRRE